MYCSSCGKELPAQAAFCPACGAAVGGAAVGGPAVGGPARGDQTSSGASTAQRGSLRPYPSSRPGISVSDKSRLATLLLCFFLGWLGVHRFYVGKVGTGVLMIFTFGGLGIWTLIDLIMIIVGGFTDIEGKFVLDWQV